jgi:hypothetical protein
MSSEADQRERQIHGVAGEFCDAASRGNCRRTLPVHRRRVDEHLQIVRGVGQESFALRRFLIRLPGVHARPHRIAPSSHPRPRVGGHVIQVARTRNRRAEKLDTGLGSLRLARHFRRVHVEVAGAGVADVALQCPFQYLEHARDRRILDVERAWSRQHQEQRFGIQCGGVQVVRIPLGDAPHRPGVLAVVFRLTRRVEPFSIARGHRPDERLLPLVGVRIGQREPLLNCRVCSHLVLWCTAFADIGSPHPGFAPETDRTIGVALLRLAKRSTGLRPRKPVHQLKALIEVGLRFSAGRRDRTCERAERGRVETDRIVEIVRQGSLGMLCDRQSSMTADEEYGTRGQHREGRPRSRLCPHRLHRPASSTACATVASSAGLTVRRSITR